MSDGDGLVARSPGGDPAAAKVGSAAAVSVGLDRHGDVTSMFDPVTGTVQGSVEFDPYSHGGSGSMFVKSLAPLVLILSGLASCSDDSSSNPYSDFEQAVGRDDVSAVVSMLRGGQDPNDYPAVLVSAARSGRVETVAALLAGGANPNVTVLGRSETPLHAAASRDDRDAATVMSMLLKSGGDPCLRVDADEPDYAERVPMPYKGMSAVEIAESVLMPGVITVLATEAEPCSSD